MRWTVLSLFLFTGVVVDNVYTNKQCREERSINGMALQGFVFKNFFVRALHECDISCERELTCQSYNFVVGGNSCELNNSTKEARPENFRSDPARFYKRRNQVCGAVGVEDKNKIPDARMTASTFHDNYYYPYYGRLNEDRGRGAWCTKTKTNRTDYLQVDMGAVQSICAVATQGHRSGSHFTTSFKVHLSTDGVTWSSYTENNVEKVFAGNTDQNSIVKHSLSPDAKARFVRVYPVTYYSWPCLRVEIFVLK